MFSAELKNASDYYLQTGRFPLEGLYLAPGWVLGPEPQIDAKEVPLNILSDARGLYLFEGCSIINELKGVREDHLPLEQRDLPIQVRNGQAYFLSGADQYHRYIEKPYYLLARADRHLLNYSRPVVQKLFDNTVVVELAVGDGKKTGQIFEYLTKSKAHAISPVRYCPNDLVRALVKKAKREACWGPEKTVLKGDKPNYPLKHAIEIPGDFYNGSTWDRINNVIKPFLGNHSVTILSQGATVFNNPTLKQLPTLLRYFELLPEGTNFLISADCTLNKAALLEEYDQPAFHHLCLTSFTHALWEAGCDFDPRSVTGCGITIDDSVDGHVTLTEYIETSSEWGTLVQDDIRKVDFEAIRRDLREHHIDAHARLIAGGPEFSRIDHGFVLATRTNKQIEGHHTTYTTMPQCTATPRSVLVPGG